MEDLLAKLCHHVLPSAACPTMLRCKLAPADAIARKAVPKQTVGASEVGDVLVERPPRDLLLGRSA
eukprot:5380598-Prorocentrum_lima.AAC.1